MTESGERGQGSGPVDKDRPAAPTTRRCRWCARPFEVVAGPGRPREYCRRSCRQRDYEARRQAGAAGLTDGQMIVARRDIDTLHDRLYALEAAIEDVERDLAPAGRPGVADYQEALTWLLSAARPLTTLRLGEPEDDD